MSVVKKRYFLPLCNSLTHSLTHKMEEEEDVVTDFLRSCQARESNLPKHKFERLVRIFKSGRRRKSMDTGATRFKLVDSDSDGKIDFEELKSYMQLHGEHDITDDDLRRFFECFSATDGNMSGLSMKEFESLMNIMESIDDTREDAYLSPKKKTIGEEMVLGDRFFILSLMGMTFSTQDDLANDNKETIDCHYSTCCQFVEPVKRKVERKHEHYIHTKHWKSHYNVEVRHAPFVEGDRVIIQADESDVESDMVLRLNGKKGTVDVLMKNGTVIVDLDETKRRVEVNVENLEHVIKKGLETQQKFVEAVVSVWRTKEMHSTPLGYAKVSVPLSAATSTPYEKWVLLKKSKRAAKESVVLEMFHQEKRASTLMLVRKNSLAEDHVARPGWCMKGERRVLIRGMFYDPSMAWMMEMERVEREQMALIEIERARSKQTDLVHMLQDQRSMFAQKLRSEHSKLKSMSESLENVDGIEKETKDDQEEKERKEKEEKKETERREKREKEERDKQQKEEKEKREKEEREKREKEEREKREKEEREKRDKEKRNIEIQEILARERNARRAQDEEMIALLTRLRDENKNLRKNATPEKKKTILEITTPTSERTTSIPKPKHQKKTNDCTTTSSKKRESIFVASVKQSLKEKAARRIKAMSRALWSIYSYYLCHKDRSIISFDRWHDFLVDCKLIPRIGILSSSFPMTRDDAGLHYVRSTASSSRGQIGGMYDFDQFVDALHNVCIQICLSDDDDDDEEEEEEDTVKKRKQMWAEFLLEFVMPIDRAKRMPEFRDNGYFLLKCGELIQLRRDFESSLRPIFAYYSSNSSTMCANEWLRLTEDLNLSRLLRLSELKWIFLSTSIILEEHMFMSRRPRTSSLDWTHFWTLLLRSCVIIYSRDNGVVKSEEHEFSQCFRCNKSKMPMYMRSLLLLFYVTLESRRHTPGLKPHVHRLLQSVVATGGSHKIESMTRLQPLTQSANRFRKVFESDWARNGYLDYGLYDVLISSSVLLSPSPPSSPRRRTRRGHNNTTRMLWSR